MSSSRSSTFGFPGGYFVIRSKATGRLLDIEHDDFHDGANVILWPEMETSLVEGFRKPEADNQVFFIDTSGALCSRSSGHAIDVEDGRLVLRHRRPVTYPFPNEFSHPFPNFSFSSTTGQITVDFACDPSFPPTGPGSPSSSAWTQRTYVLSSIPLQKPRSILFDASEAISSALYSPLTLFGAPPSTPTVEDLHRSDIDLREDEVVEEDRAAGEEADDSLERGRKVRVLAVNEDDDEHATVAALQRRKWEVVPLRQSRASRSKSSGSRLSSG